MAKRKALIMLGALAILIFPLVNVSQATLVNGDFSNGLLGWTTTDDFVEPSLSVSAGSGYALLATQEYPVGPSLISLYQEFQIPSWAYTLSFDIGLQTPYPDEDGTGENFFDFVQVSYLDKEDLLFDRYLLNIDVAGPYDPNSLLSVTLPQFELDGLIWYHYSTNIADLRGHYGTLYFDLSDQDDGWFSMAYVDNVQISPVPEPATFLLLASGLAGLGGFLRKRRKFMS